MSDVSNNLLVCLLGLVVKHASQQFFSHAGTESLLLGYLSVLFGVNESRTMTHIPSASSDQIRPRDQDPVVQSIVSLTISLRHKFVKQISAKVTNTLLFFVEKM